jgi:hypothetical protein
VIVHFEDNNLLFDILAFYVRAGLRQKSVPAMLRALISVFMHIHTYVLKPHLFPANASSKKINDEAQKNAENWRYRVPTSTYKLPAIKTSTKLTENVDRMTKNVNKID